MFHNIQSPSEFLMIWFNNALLEEEEQTLFNRYYTSYLKSFPPRIQYFYDKQLEGAMKILSKIDNPKVLEVGCGLGSESLFMALHGANVLGIDIDDKRVNTAKCRKDVMEKQLDTKLNCDFKNISVLELDEVEQYDLIWIEQAYHHLEPREMVSEKISLLLKPNGYLVISESNALNPLIQLALFKQRGFETINYHTDSQGLKRPYGNERVLTARRLIKNFKKYTIENKRIEYFRIFPNSHYFDKLLIFEKVFPKFLSLFFTHYNYIGQKRS
ncbi:MAG: Unknown protein [uncultured Sulfurovum sp.]|uniref:Methyltransferase domain-containing protein n=1 Tax=uncultured Sulfurovum sp. TaxID=269237 RepID=A0A6S6T8V8_9BACT|nr:MAG: Unknown protein [uncultured Sulfurovum sp.]